LYGAGYTARIPAVKARQIYVAETIDTEVGLKGGALCDIGGGEGQFLDIAKAEPYGALPFAIEPSEANCRMLTGLGIENYQGTIEEFLDSNSDKLGSFDFVTIMWTLENCRSCRDMLNAANALLRTGGHIVVATGSRVLVPFKKPLHYYLSKNPADTHSFRFSANTLRGLLAVSGFETVYTNRYIDTDFLVVIAQKAPSGEKLTWTGDDPDDVADFFARWHTETAAHYNDA
jgi:2-polyprenyl-3-methyl-5-hydroxy-6-metoxy-1,4-benzoquinol methylase